MQFTFQSHIVREALASLYNVKETYSQAVTFIGVHIRRGDIVNATQCRQKNTSTTP